MTALFIHVVARRGVIFIVTHVNCKLMAGILTVHADGIIMNRSIWNIADQVLKSLWRPQLAFIFSMAIARFRFYLHRRRSYHSDVAVFRSSCSVISKVRVNSRSVTNAFLNFYDGTELIQHLTVEQVPIGFFGWRNLNRDVSNETDGRNINQIVNKQIRNR